MGEISKPDKCGPVEVTIVDDPTAQIDVEVDYVCNADTGIYDIVTTTFTDGVAGEPAIVASDVSCVAEPEPVVTADIEYFCDEAADVWAYTVTTIIDGVAQAPSAPVLTAISCDDPNPEPLDIIEVDTEIVCNSETGFYEYHQITTTNGVPSAPIITTTTITCQPEPPIDVEQVRQCSTVTNTIHIVTTAFDSAGNPIEVVDDIDTGEACNDDPFAKFTVQCCVQDPALGDRFCTTFPPDTFEGDILIGGEIAATLASGWTEQDLLGQLGPAFFADAEGRLCSAERPAAMVFTGQTCLPEPDPVTGIICTLFKVAKPFLAIAGEEAECECALRTQGCLDEALLQSNTNQEAALEDLLEKDDCVPVCRKWSSVNIQLDNTGTHFSEATTITLENTDGSTFTFVTGPHVSWSAQVADIAAQMDTYYSAAIYDPRCTTGCGGLNPPPSDVPAQPGIFARYINGTHCPTDLVIPTSATAFSDTRSERKLPFFATPTPEYRGTQCLCCDGEPGPLKFDDGTEVPEADLPVCVFDCAESIPVPPPAACSFAPIGIFCEITPGDTSNPEAETDPIIATENVVLTQVTCGADVSITGYTIDENGDPVEHVLGEGNYYGDCLTLDPVIPDPPPCPENATWTQVETGGWYGILDNSLWTDLPVNHLQNGNAYEFTFTLADGSTVVWQQTSDPYFNSFINTAPAAVPGLTVVPVCANHTSPNGCNANHVANLATYPAYDAPTAPGDPQNNVANPALSELWATGWMLDGGDCAAPIVRAEITAANDASHVGAFKDIIVYDKPRTTLFQAVTCDGVFYKDCDGNAVEAPGCCPAVPSTAGGSGSDLVNTTCEIADAVTCGIETTIFDSSNANIDEATLGADGLWSVIPSQTNANTSMNQLIEQIEAGCTLAAVYVLEDANTGNIGWIVVPAAAVTGDATGYTIDPAIVADFGACDAAEAVAALNDAGAGLSVTDGAFQAGPLFNRGTNEIIFATPPDGTANGRCLTVVEQISDLPSPSHNPVHDTCAYGKLCEIEEAVSRNPAPFKVAERCFEQRSSLVDTDNVIDQGGVPVEETVFVFPNDGGLVEEICIRIINNGVDPAGVPFMLDIDGIEYSFDQSTVGSGPLGPLPGNIPPGRYDVCFPIPGGLNVQPGQEIQLTGVQSNGGGLAWTTGSDSDGFQTDSLSNGQWAQFSFFIAGISRWSECEFSDGSITLFGPDGAEVDEIPSSADQVRCDSAAPISANTHLIEGCIEVEGENVSAFTIVGDDGAPLFPPRPLTDLGFGECC